MVVNKSAAVTRIYLPPDVNSLLSVADHCLRSENYVNVIVSDKQLHLQYMDMDAAIRHCTKGIGIWDWASNDQGGEPDVVLASAGDIPTQEALAAIALLRTDFSDLKSVTSMLLTCSSCNLTRNILMGWQTGTSTLYLRSTSRSFSISTATPGWFTVWRIVVPTIVTCTYGDTKKKPT